MKIAVIPARGGSKRIPRKNIREFAGKPMLAWSVEAAQNSGLFEHIIVSTDDEEIARVAEDYGAKVPFLRPQHLADDYSPTRPVVNHAIREANRLWGAMEFVCCIYATAPFLRAEDLVHGYEKLVMEQREFSIAVTTYPYPIQRALLYSKDTGLQMFFPKYAKSRSQDLQPAYHDAGLFYWGKTAAFLDGLSTFSSAATPVVLPRWRVHDIDTEEDWKTAELVFNALDSDLRK